MEAFTSSGLTALIILTFLEIALGVFPSESYTLKAQTAQLTDGSLSVPRLGEATHDTSSRSSSARGPNI